MNVIIKFSVIALVSFCCISLSAQHRLNIAAELDIKNDMLQIEQEIIFKNTAAVALDTIYFLDWANSFSSKTTPLADRFSYDFKSNFHFEKEERRGRTKVHYIANDNKRPLQWRRYKEADIIQVLPEKSIAPGESYTFTLLYEVKLPDAKFTRFGHLKNEDYNLQYWYIAPAVFDGDWKLYSNKDIDDFYTTPSTYAIAFKAPEAFHLITDINTVSDNNNNGLKTTRLYGENRKEIVIYLQNQLQFESMITDNVTILTSIEDNELFPPMKAIQINRIVKFLENELGEYPFDKMVVSEESYRRSPVYGLNQLPSFIRPFPDGFQYDIEQLKTITYFYLKNTLQIDPRKEHWIIGAMQIYLMMKYTDIYYPDMKIAGNLSKVWGLRWFHASQLEFNDQYPMLYTHMARLNLDQPLTTSKDSLVKFNQNIASNYKGGVGFNYLDYYLGENIVSKSMKAFFELGKQQPVNTATLDSIFKNKTTKDTDWFFKEYVSSNTKIDYKIKGIKKVDDSLHITIKNKRNNTMPISLYGLYKNTILESQWLDGFEKDTTVVLYSEGIDRVAVNYNHVIPEYNKRNNYRKVKGLFRKPIQFRVFQDVEDPEYHQLFLMPIFQYNLYDGLIVGTRMYNKTLLTKDFLFRADPQYGTTSNHLVGGASMQHTINFENQNLFYFRYGIGGSYYSFDRDLFYRRLSGYATLAFREDDLRSNRRKYLTLRNVMVNRDENPLTASIENPNYNIINLQYMLTNINLIDHFVGKLDYEVASTFQKVYTTVEYRKLFLNNRQLNLRFFAGAFLFNNNDPKSNFYSFALDRPTDYLFDYNYYGRSEASGLFSQQLIMAEGGFKSKLDTPFANRWIVTGNASTNIWRWIYAYGDVGIVNNKGVGSQVVYDSGIRVSLVTDFFEIYFPVYSSNGWETSLPNYDQRIRFIVTLSPNTLMKLFTRRWY